MESTLSTLIFSLSHSGTRTCLPHARTQQILFQSPILSRFFVYAFQRATYAKFSSDSCSTIGGHCISAPRTIHTVSEKTPSLRLSFRTERLLLRPVALRKAQPRQSQQVARQLRSHRRRLPLCGCSSAGETRDDEKDLLLLMLS